MLVECKAAEIKLNDDVLQQVPAKYLFPAHTSLLLMAGVYGW
jgi:hypothetical protein